MDNPKSLITLGTQDTGQRQSKVIDNIRHPGHRAKTIQSH
jgi:hypothetical protein